MISLIGCRRVDPVQDAVVWVAMLVGVGKSFLCLSPVLWTPLGCCDDKYVATAAAAAAVVATGWTLVIHCTHPTEKAKLRQDDYPLCAFMFV